MPLEFKLGIDELRIDCRAVVGPATHRSATRQNSWLCLRKTKLAFRHLSTTFFRASGSRTSLSCQFVKLMERIIIEQIILLRGRFGRSRSGSTAPPLVIVGLSARLRRQGIGNLRGCSESFCAEVRHGKSGTRGLRIFSRAVVGSITRSLSVFSCFRFSLARGPHGNLPCSQLISHCGRNTLPTPIGSAVTDVTSKRGLPRERPARNASACQPRWGAKSLLAGGLRSWRRNQTGLPVIRVVTLLALAPQLLLLLRDSPEWRGYPPQTSPIPPKTAPPSFPQKIMAKSFHRVPRRSSRAARCFSWIALKVRQCCVSPIGLVLVALGYSPAVGAAPAL
jgi:hypothetical protein